MRRAIMLTHSTRATPVLVALAAALWSCAQTASPPAPGAPACNCSPTTVPTPDGSTGPGASASPSAAPSQPRPPRTPPVSTAVRFEPGIGEAGFLPRGDPLELGIDGGVLDALVKEAEATHSDSLIVVRSGKVVVERYFGHPRAPLETMSITKSISSLAVGLLLAEGKITSLDAPLSTWFPEWKEGKRSRVTLRHVLTHTTGMQKKPGIRGLNAAKDRLAHARKLSIEEDPGESFFYSNEATQLLAGVVEAAARTPLDSYLQKKLFDPLGIRGVFWARDRADKPQAYFGVALHARDLARIALLMLDGGQHEGKPIVPASWVRESTSPGLAVTPQYGLLWWLKRDSPWHTTGATHLDTLRERGFRGAERLRPLVGKALAGAEAWWGEAGALLDTADRDELAQLARRGVLPFATQPGRQVGFYSDGSRGQKLGVFPAHQLIAVRQHHSEAGDEDGLKYGLASFHTVVESLVTVHPADAPPGP